MRLLPLLSGVLLIAGCAVPSPEPALTLPPEAILPPAVAFSDDAVILEDDIRAELGLVQRHTLVEIPTADDPVRFIVTTVASDELRRVGLGERLTAFDDLLAARPDLAAYEVPLADEGEPLPDPITLEAAQVFNTHPAYVGSGLRYVTLYAQYLPMPNNDALRAVYLEHSADRTAVIKVTMLVRHPSLPETDPTIDPEQYDQSAYGDFLANYAAIVVPMVAALAEQPPDTFEPGLATLDAFVQSIRVLSSGN
ncbi:MAG: hypothetical protein GYB64_17660 [Chloroflexi bacterium]|nr:hypothetical protein [Chloroflexota bacterium]